jgi:hypothetical protein
LQAKSDANEILEFLVLVKNDNASLSDKAIALLLHLVSKYLRETRYFVVADMKTKHLSRVTLQVNISSMTPRRGKLCRKASSSIKLNQALATCGTRTLISYYWREIQNCYILLQIQKPVPNRGNFILENKTAVVFCIY